MTEPLGRREASKQATRAALLAAASELFAERGFEATTVRDIAAAAQVTERTFYRYFDGKEGLVGGEFPSWLERVRDAIVARPASEPPAVAIRRALIDAGQDAAVSLAPLQLWLFHEGPTGLRRFAPRPLLQLESAIADAAVARTPDGAGPFRARVISRVAVAALRSAVIAYRERGAPDPIDLSALSELLETAFAIIGEEYGREPR